MAKFDCTVYRPICTGIGVDEYPCIVWMKNGRIKERFHCRHDAESLKTFIFEMMQAKNAPNTGDNILKMDEEELPSLEVNLINDDFVDYSVNREVIQDSKTVEDSIENPYKVNEDDLASNEAKQDPGANVNKPNFDAAPENILARNENSALDYNSTTNLNDTADVPEEFKDDFVDTPTNDTLSEIEVDPLETNRTENSSKARDEEKLKIAVASNESISETVGPTVETPDDKIDAEDPSKPKENVDEKSVEENHEIKQKPHLDSPNSNEPSSNSSEVSSINSTVISKDESKEAAQPYPIKIISGEDSELLADSAASAPEEFSSENPTILKLESDSNSSEASEDISSNRSLTSSSSNSN